MPRFKRFDSVLSGGLVREPITTIDALGSTMLAEEQAFSIPAWIDSRPYCIESSNQGEESSCAGFTVAGYKEVRHWSETHVQKQFDGRACYKQAKKLDGSPRTAGTTLSAAVKAAIKLGWFPEDTKIRVIHGRREVQFALHKGLVCIAGFDMTKEWQTVDLDTGLISVGNTSSLGGHAVLVCYYDETSVGWQNSWGKSWGVKGFGRMTWAQFSDQFLYAVALDV